MLVGVKLGVKEEDRKANLAEPGIAILLTIKHPSLDAVSLTYLSSIECHYGYHHLLQAVVLIKSALR
jgi:hypothetical protein